MQEHMNNMNQLLGTEVIDKYLVFGTDWPLARHKLKLKTYINFYKNRIQDQEKRDKFFSDNLAEFIFGPKKQIPDNYIKLIKKTKPQFDVPGWIEKRNGKYYLV